MKYQWKYSKKTEPRGRILFKAIEPLLEEGDKFLDVDCGYSPMAKHILEHGHSITGFDIAPEPIHHLRRTQPQGHWPATPDADAQFQGYTVLLLLGVTTALKKVYSRTYYETTERLLWLNTPRVILIESADAADQVLYLQICELLENTGRYAKKLEGKFDAEMESASKRHYSIWKRTSAAPETQSPIVETPPPPHEEEDLIESTPEEEKENNIQDETQATDPELAP